MAATEHHHFIQDAEHLKKAIGGVVIVFQLIELWVAEALAVALKMQAEGDRHLVSAAMSYRQKVDLLFELYARHPDRAPAVNLSLAKRALLVAEQFRNRVVHSVWAVSGEPRTWVRTKANLRGNGGLVVRTTPAKIDYLVAASSALEEIRGWEFVGDADLLKAIDLLKSGESDA